MLAHGQSMFWKKIITRMIAVLFQLKPVCMDYQMQNINHIELQVILLKKMILLGKLIEFPLLVTTFLGKKIPAGGGFYLRTLPMKVIKNAFKNYQNKNMPGCFYIHSWELTPEFMPKLDLPFKDKFATYHNLGKAYSRMDRNY